MPLSRLSSTVVSLTTSCVLLLFLSVSYGQSPSLDRSVRTLDNFEPAIPRPEQDKAVTKKMADLQKQTGKKPNILWLVVDDMGYGDPGCFGGGAAIGAATPNIDRLAREGLKLTSCYSQQTCTPTRSAILTGRLPRRTGLTRPILAGDKLTQNPWSDEVSLPSLLNDAGYFTLLTGKWHVGEPTGMRPHDIGFDEYYGYYPAQKEISQRYDARRFPDLVNDPERMRAFEAIAPDDHLIHGFKGGRTEKVSQIQSIEDMGRAEKGLADFTVQRIKELAKKDQPFFIEHCFMKVHCDNFPNPDLGTLSAAKYYYKEAVAEVDLHVGEIVKALDEAGELENTFIFFTSDNGPQMDGWPDAGYTPFRGAKGTTFEGGVRVPGIAYWKGMIKAGRESDDLFDLMDLFGTSLNLAGVSTDTLASDRYYDFIDQTSFLIHDEGASKRDAVYFWWGNQLMSCRMREYKVHVKVVLPESTHMHIDYSTLQDVGLAPWLFNLYIDPKEQSPVGHRRNAWLATVLGKLKTHAATFKKYPPKEVGL
ncbi:Arylsulfatase [Polystyrenella longa]|uniref:Arylsulfatase n=1 Tax=Polystyrenella longa TaxID=2528007 RepID=A0A518CSW7_9PLAN|nr:arylsulfatase [Polystyrenella longa]QDU82323.1 Arylsulfatase [Polystyrenella longa]